MFFKLVGGLALSLLLSVAALAADYALTEAQQQIVMHDIRSRLKDPMSAIFGKYKATKHGNRVALCGLVNAKNGYGGYVGDQLFIGIIDIKENTFRFAGMTSGLDTNVDEFLWNRCTKNHQTN